MFPRYRIRINVNSRFIELFVFAVFYRILLDWVYRDIIVHNYGYMGFWNSESIMWAVLSWGLLLFFTALIHIFYQNSNNLLSYEIVFLLFLFSIIPFTSMVNFGMLTPSFIIANSLYWLLLLFSVYLIGKRKIILNHVHFSGFFFEDYVIKAITVISFLIVFYISGRFTHFRFNFNLANVYVLRAEAKSFQLPTVLKYLFSWTRIINTVLIAYFMQRKMWPWVVVGIMAQLLNFGIDGAKTTLFFLVAAIFINFLPKIELSKINRWILIGFPAMILLFGLSYFWLNSIMPISLLARRMLFIPVQLESFYWDFFTTHAPDYFRQSFARHFGFTSPYSSIPYLIGELYEGKITSANNGLISDAIANLGYVGILVMPIFHAIIFNLLDRCSEGLDSRLCVTVVIYLTISLTNSFIFTVLLSHGLIVTMVLLYLMRRVPSPQKRLSIMIS